MSQLPKLDNRDFSDIMDEIKNLARQYTPEWNFSQYEEDFGVVFSKVFAHMMTDTISRYNKTLYNYYLRFLNTLGTKLRPASSSNGMVIVESNNSDEGAYIEKGSRLFAEVDTETGSVVYETVDSLTAVGTSIRAVYFTDGQKDTINCIYKNIYDDNKLDLKPFRIYDNVFNENLQAHEIYFFDNIVFDMSNTNIEFLFYNNISGTGQKLLPEIFSDKNNVTWEYYDKNNTWAKIDNKNIIKTDNGVRIKFEDKTEVNKILNIESRFIRCRFNKIPKNGINVTSIKYKSQADNVKNYSVLTDDTELDVVDFYPFGEEYNNYTRFNIMCDEAFSKKNSVIELNLEMEFIKIKKEFQAPSTKFKTIMRDVDFADLEPGDIKIEKVKWEYWNGKGWARLELLDNYDDFFSIKETEKVTNKDKIKDINNKKNNNRILKFKCPDDMEKISIGPLEGYFIRAHIVKTSDRYDYYANYITPFVKNIKIKYDYNNIDNLHEFDKLIVRSNLSEKIVNFSDKKLVSIISKCILDEPVMYICLSKPLIQGMIRILINMEEAVHRFNPVLKWEYLAKDYKGGKVWKHIDIIDDTDNFAHTETITFIGKNDFVEDSIFGVTGYFLRVVNPDKKYSNQDNVSTRPVINNIKFNAVKIVQTDTRLPEFFWINSGEENKLCKLSNKNVTQVEVWIDEFNKISSSEQDKFLKFYSRDEVEPEYNELGQLEKLWVKWKPVPNLVAYGVTDRVYEIDYPKGEILFGNGRNGKIPPEQYNESIKIKYSICYGTKGNIEANEIRDFEKSIKNVTKVYNISPIMGGIDKETIDNAASRTFGQISSGSRLVSLNDFEDSIKFYDRNIYKVRCLSHIDEYNNKSMGVTSVAILPRIYMQGYEKFQGIKNRIWDFIDQRAPAALANSSRLRIFEVSYVETIVNLDVIIEDFNYYQVVYSGIESRLKQFLDPVSGNFSGEGWEIGEFPRKEFIYNFIKTVPHIKWIKSINIFTNLITQEGKKELDYEKIKNYKFIVPVYGNSEINININ